MKTIDLSLFFLPFLSIRKHYFYTIIFIFQRKKFLNDNQYGSRAKYSTEYGAIELIYRIVTNMDKNDLPIYVFLDLSKAFDTVDHNILQNKLAYYGLNGLALHLFKSYLQNRKQFTEIEQINSDILPITIGVPQGSVLGPLLFIIYINDFSQASQLFNFVMYADDTTLSTSLNSLSEMTLDNKSTETIINEL